MLREAQGVRRYNTQITLTYTGREVDDYGHATYTKPIEVAKVYASVERMSEAKVLMTFQQAEVIGLDIELRNPNVLFNGIDYQGHEVHFVEPEQRERGRILRISGWYQVDH